jgi:replicative DNA helicase
MKSQENLAYERGLPVNLEAERFVLGSVMLNDVCFPQVLEALSVEDFAIEKHRRIFSRMKDLDSRTERIDRVTVANELMKQGQLESVDGLSYLVSLDEGMPQLENLESYLHIVKDRSTLRKTIFIMQKFINNCMLEIGTPDEIILALEQELLVLGDQSTKQSAMTNTREMIEKIGVDALLSPRSRGTVELPFKKLDEILYGLRGGQMVVLMARTSRGKSSMAYQIATSAAIQGQCPAVWTMEVSPRDAFQCIVQQLSGVWPEKYHLTLEERHEINMAVCQLGENLIYFDDRARNVPEFVARLRRVKQKHKLGMAVVDHLQLIRGTSKYRAQEVSENSRALKLAAMDLDIPILVLSQVDRASVKGDGKIGLHSAKESGDIENDADVVMWLDSEEEFSWERDTVASLHIGKNRTGRAGLKLPMLFQPKRRAFAEIAEYEA